MCSTERIFNELYLQGMAMEMTHVRFAKELQEILNVSDVNAYYCGAIYPDSRYFTGLPRVRTHGEHSPKLSSLQNATDFEKGWATHLYYDEVATAKLRSIPGCPSGKNEQGNYIWQFNLE